MDGYERYIEECEAKEREAAESGEAVVSVDENGEEQNQVPVIDEAKWKERRECLEMLKKELRRVRDGGNDQYDWDYLLEEDEKEENDEKKDEKKDDQETFSDIDDEKCNSKTRLNSTKDDNSVVTTEQETEEKKKTI